MTARAILYARSATGEGDALLHQKIALSAYAKACGYEVVRVLEDIGSGLQINPGLEQALRLIDEQAADTVLVTSYDRLTRDRVQLEQFFQTCPIESVER